MPCLQRQGPHGTRVVEDELLDTAKDLLHGRLQVTERGGFVATVERSSGDLVAKLPRARVAELIDSGIGAPFAPAGRVFREWVAVSADHIDRWEALVTESIDFVSTQ